MTLEEKFADFLKSRPWYANQADSLRSAYFEGAAVMAEINAAAEKRPLYFNVTVHGAAPVSAGGTSGGGSGGSGGGGFPANITSVKS